MRQASLKSKIMGVKRCLLSRLGNEPKFGHDSLVLGFVGVLVMVKVEN
jgi:hypothetical protein